MITNHTLVFKNTDFECVSGDCITVVGHFFLNFRQLFGSNWSF